MASLASPSAADGGAPDRARQRSERRTATALIGVFVGAALMLAGVSVRGSLATGRARAALAETLAQVGASQAAFRRAHARFASWEELEARGVRLPARQRVVRASASASHWYLAVLDEEAGLVCDRTGELFEDERGAGRPPTCRPAQGEASGPSA